MGKKINFFVIIVIIFIIVSVIYFKVKNKRKNKEQQIEQFSEQEDYEFLKLLKDKKLLNAYKFYISCMYKLYCAEISYKAAEEIVQKMKNENKQNLQKSYRKRIKKKIIKVRPQNHIVNYCGFTIDSTTMLNKLTMEIMSLMHSFFDVYAQWTNAVLLGERALGVGQVSLKRLEKELKQYPEYKDNYRVKLKDIINDSKYKYIEDFNNTLKHRYQIYVKNQFDILQQKEKIYISKFKKGNNIHEQEELIELLGEHLEFCKEILNDSYNSVKEYYTNNECRYVSHRIYNPKTFMLYESKQSTYPKNHYYYIVERPENILNQYQIMLCHDDGKNIDYYNSVYKRIIIKDSEEKEIIGMIERVDHELTMEDEAEYVKYKLMENYEQEKYKEICGNGKFSYYPLLSDAIIYYMNK